ncbi:RsbR, positive regulator of sigma-B [Aurantiacibacter atlanticus]|uniref:RsbR, positive regulator of sigma-B n=1 Tax=Aurantiacibacter atlanticus TaxID=1648404 RepID=A0A0H4VH07_9SPHN|nr:STAS domain-containing protein [Aurantiacibacter atlanticus]AKQ42329.1 RsbR, positive regulator of sigma-B [Aurantiacibacter atlanticus]MDF1834797.1 STAS domain-containing protein [Alteraurantiacibacter sp. bin_em_oilr2.035]
MTNGILEATLEVLKEDVQGILHEWIEQADEDGAKRADLFSEKEERDQAASLLRAFRVGVRDTSRGGEFVLKDEHWADLRGILSEITHERVERGVLPGEMAALILALKVPLFSRLKEKLSDSPDLLIDEVILLSKAIDAFAIYTNEVFIAEREQIIERQRDEMLELSTPVVELWDKVLTLPLIGTLDSLRAQEVMESLLQAIVERQAEVVIVDITGVKTVDTQVAQHLLRTAAAVRLMGATCIISGISPKIAQTMVELGVDVGEVLTRSSIKSALTDALTSVGVAIRAIDDNGTRKP